MPISKVTSSNIQQPSFKGKWDRTEQGTPYYKTNSGTTAGAILAIPAGLTWLNKMKYKEPSAEEMQTAKDMFKEAGMDDFFKKLTGGKNIEETLKMGNENALRMKKYAIPFAVLAAGLTAGCGMLVDKFRNDKAKETADIVKQAGVKNAVMNNDRIALSNKGRAYYESNQGSKYGAFLGAGCGIIGALMQQGKNTKISEAIGSALTFAIGGWIMGKIADSNSNKDARRHA